MSVAHGLLPTSNFKPTTGIAGAIARASARTGVDFDYLLTKAKMESSLNPTAAAKTSSARGLYQFTQNTWLEMVRDHGAKYGLGTYAKCIDNACQVKDADLKRQILALRDDPETSAVMAAEYTARNAKTLQKRLGDATPIGETELYLAHFMGAGGASKFLRARADNPDQIAAKLFPAEARANRNVFYDRATGQPRTLDDIYAHFDQNWHEGDMIATRSGQATTSKPTIAREDVDALLAAPATEHSIATRQVDTMLAEMKQAQLLILAQTYLHADNARYNS
jgi:hypothetical protein